MTTTEQLADINRTFARLKTSPDWIAANKMVETARAIAEAQPKLPALADIQKLLGAYRPVVPPQPLALRFSDLARLPPPRRRSIVRPEVKRKIGF